MDSGPESLVTVHARMELPSATVELQRVNLPEEFEGRLPLSHEHRIDYSLTRRTPDARLSFEDDWPRHRFEPLGKVYLVPAGRQMRARSAAGSQEAVICHLKQTALEEWPRGIEDRYLDACLDIHSGTLNRVMMQLGEEVRAPGFATIAMCEALSMQVAVELARYHIARDQAAGASILTPRRLAIIDDRLHQTPAAPSLTELAALCGISVRHLTRAFRAVRGCSIGTFIRQHQIEVAKRALEKDENVKAIAHMLGFSSRSSFSHAFQKATGMGPCQYRRQEQTASAFRSS